MTLRSYVALLRLEDCIHTHPFFFRAAVGMLRCYILLYAKKQLRDSGENGQKSKADLSTMTPGERKRAKQRARKEAAKKRKADKRKKLQRSAAAAQETLKRGNSSHNNGNKSRRRATDKCHDAKLIEQALEAPLSTAANGLLARLCSHWSKCTETHVILFDVALRRGKLTAALRALKRALRTVAHLTEIPTSLLCRLIELSCFVRKCRMGQLSGGYLPNPVCLGIASVEIDSLLAGAVPAALANAYLHHPITRAFGGLERRAAGACALVAATRLDLGSPDSEPPVTNATFFPGSGHVFAGLEECVRVNALISSTFDLRTADEHKNACMAYFPLAFDRFSVYGCKDEVNCEIRSKIMWSSLI